MNSHVEPIPKCRVEAVGNEPDIEPLAHHQTLRDQRRSVLIVLEGEGAFTRAKTPVAIRNV